MCILRIWLFEYFYNYMAQFETETKVLDVDWDRVIASLRDIGATHISDRAFEVDWYRPVGEKLGEENWYLRTRRWSNGQAEVTWKGKREVFQNSRRHQEIELLIADAEKLGQLFELIGLEHYAHQEKKRSTWTYKEWKFDLDQYPKMPAYLEIEGTSDAHIMKAVALLQLTDHERCFDGERVLIMEKYGLDWLDMRF